MSGPTQHHGKGLLDSQQAAQHTEMHLLLDDALQLVAPVVVGGAHVFPCERALLDKCNVGSDCANSQRGVEEDNH